MKTSPAKRASLLLCLMMLLAAVSGSKSAQAQGPYLPFQGYNQISYPYSTTHAVAPVRENGYLSLVFKNYLNNQLYIMRKFGAGGAWGAPYAIPGNMPGTSTPFTTSAAPAAVVVPAPVGDDIYVFAKGPNGNNYIYYNRASYITGAWSGWTQIPGSQLSALGPAVTTTNLYTINVFIKGDNVGPMFVNRLSSGSWGGWSQIPGGVQTSVAPAPMVFGSTLALFRKLYSTNDMYYQLSPNTSSSTFSWGTDTKVTKAGSGGVETNNTPSGVQLFKSGVFNYVAFFHVDKNSHYILFQTSPDLSANSWSDTTQVGYIQSTEGPATIVYDGVLHLFVVNEYGNLINENKAAL